MRYQTAVVLGLLPQLPLARVICSLARAANSGDICQSFATAWGQTVNDFAALNPGVSCSALSAGQDYCILGTITNEPEPSTTTSVRPVTTLKPTTAPAVVTSAAASPNQPTLPGTLPNCNRYHLVVPGDQCNAIADKYGISLGQFLGENLSVNSGTSRAAPVARIVLTFMINSMYESLERLLRLRASPGDTEAQKAISQ